MISTSDCFERLEERNDLAKKNFAIQCQSPVRRLCSPEYLQSLNNTFLNPFFFTVCEQPASASGLTFTEAISNFRLLASHTRDSRPFSSFEILLYDC